MNRDEVRPGHLERLAYVYVRQSTAHQVVHYKESQRRQRQLVERAVELGWPHERLVVIDEDLGETASRSGRKSHPFVTPPAISTVPESSSSAFSRDPGFVLFESLIHRTPSCSATSSIR